MPVMTSEEWKSLTEVKLKVRDSRLRALDRALEGYHRLKNENSENTLRVALHHWMDGSDGYASAAGMPVWMLHERNRRRGVEKLACQVYGIGTEFLGTPELRHLAHFPFFGLLHNIQDPAAKETVWQAQMDSVHTLVHGTEVLAKRTWVAEAFLQLDYSARKAKDSAAKVESAMSETVKEQFMPQVEQLAWELIDKVLGDYPREVATEVIDTIRQIVPEIVLELGHSLVPYLSIAVSGSRALTDAATAIWKEVKSLRAGSHVGSFRTGDPRAAAEAIKEMIDRQRNYNTTLAGIYGAETGGKAAALILDAAAHGAPVGQLVLGAVSSLTKCLALLCLRVYLVGREIYERYKANQILKNSSGVQITGEIFEACPVLGCYYVASTDTSNLVNFLSGMGYSGWNLDVNKLIKNHIEPMVKTARYFIEEANLEVRGLERSKGVVKDQTTLTARMSNSLASRLRSVIPFIEKPEPPAVPAFMTRPGNAAQSWQTRR